MLIALPKNVFNNSPVEASITANVSNALSESDVWVNPTIVGPKSVQYVGCGLFASSDPPSQGSTLVVPGLNACITNAWSNGSPPSGTRDRPSAPASDSLPASATVPVAPGRTASTKAAIWGFVTLVFP